jgi:hypothetical protein
LGLSFSPTSEKATSIFQQMLDENKLDHPLFTVFYKRCPNNVDQCADGGVVTFGKHDIKNCGAIQGFTQPIDKKDSLWQFNVEELSIDGFTYSTPKLAVTDTAASHIRVAKSVLDQIVAKVGATESPPAGR